MRGREPLAFQGGPGSPPRIIDSADADAAGEESVEGCRIARHGLEGERIDRLLKRTGEGVRALRDGPLRQGGRRDGCPEPDQELGLALVPEYVIEGKRHEGRVGPQRRDVGDAGSQPDRALARIGEAALRGDEEQPLGIGEDPPRAGQEGGAPVRPSGSMPKAPMRPMNG